MYFCNTCKNKHEIGEICSTPIHNEKDDNMAMRDTLTTISTTDMTIRERREKIKNNMRITDEQIFIAGITYYENELTKVETVVS